MFELNKRYTGKELAQTMGLSYKTFANNRKKYLQGLQQYCRFRVEQQGRSFIYIITEQWAEQEPLSKGQEHMSKIRDLLRYDIFLRPDGGRQTNANIGEMLADQVGLAPSSTARYASTVLKQYYGEKEGDVGEDGRVVRLVWAYYLGNIWQELPEAVYQELKDDYEEALDEAHLGTDAEMGAFEDAQQENENTPKLPKDELQAKRMKIYNKTKFSLCAKYRWRWIMRVKEYKVHPGEPPKEE